MSGLDKEIWQSISRSEFFSAGKSWKYVSSGEKTMRSIIILCTALLFIVLSAVLSVAVYEQYGAVNLQPAVRQSEKIKDDNIVDGISASFLSTDNTSSEFDSSISRNVYSWITEFSSGRNFSRSTFEPVSIFLFGAGLIGVAIFSRRKLNNNKN